MYILAIERTVRFTPFSNVFAEWKMKTGSSRNGNQLDVAIVDDDNPYSTISCIKYFAFGNCNDMF